MIMEKKLVITFNHAELTEILGVDLLLHFGEYKVNGELILEETVDDAVESFEQILIEHVKNTQPSLFNPEPTGSYANLYPLGLSAVFKSNQELSGSVSILYPETSM